MKKFYALVLCVLMVATMLFAAGCSSSETTSTPATSGALKFGSAVYVSTPTTTDATPDNKGSGKVDITVAAVLLDADGKIVACALDTASNTVNFTVNGAAVANTEFKTKYELGFDYNMVNYQASTKEWFEQVDAFEAVVVGKTLSEVKALVAEGNKGNSEVVAAGCTIMIHEFVGAIEKACAAAKDSTATEKDLLVVTASTEQTCTDATEDNNGSNKVTTTVFAAAVGTNGKVVVASSDCVEVSFTFDNNGVSKLDTTKAVLSKKEQGDDYGMVKFQASTTEWYAQAAAFDAACVGKNATEIAGLMAEDGKGVADLQAAGCTIYITGFVKAAVKIG